MDIKLKPIEIIENPIDQRFENFRTIKTLCIIMIIFCIGLIFRNDYIKLVENSRFLKFYPTTTVFYQEFTDIGEFNNLKIPEEFKKASYGIFLDDRGQENFLMISQTSDEDTPIIDTPKYSMFTQNGYIFLSDNPEELENLQHRINHKNYEILHDKNIKKLLKTLDKKRDFTIMISDINYIGLPVDSEIKEILSKIFDKAIIQVFKDKENIKVSGELTFKNKIANLASCAKQLAENFSFRQIKIEKFSEEKPVLIIAVKDFDLWTKTFLHITKNLPDNQYSATFDLIQNVFHSDIESDIIQKLNGNAVFYLFKKNDILHPMLILETKRNLANQIRKYFSFLQLQNKSTLTEKELNNKTYNVLSSGIYPHNLSFGNFNDKLFAIGHQNIIENFAEKQENNILVENCDFYLYTNVNTLPILHKNTGFWTGYNTIELKLSLTPDVKFEGSLIKQD